MPTWQRRIGGGGYGCGCNFSAARLGAASGIGLPIAAVEGDLNGLRLGTPEIVRAGLGPEHMPVLASLIVRALIGNEEPETVATAATALRRQFTGLRFVR